MKKTLGPMNEAFASSFSRFESLAKRLLAVPKEEVDELRKQIVKKPHKSRAKKSAA